MTLTRFADIITLASTRTADPLAAGIERFAATGADKSAPQHMKVLRTHRPHRVGCGRLPRTEAGIYPPPPPRAKQFSADEKQRGSSLHLKSDLARLAESIPNLLRPHLLLDILANFTLFATDKKKRRLKLICRYQ